MTNMKFKDSLNLRFRNKQIKGKNNAGRVGNLDHTAKERDREVKKRNFFDLLDSQ